MGGAVLAQAEQSSHPRLPLGTILTFSAPALPIASLIVGMSIYLQPYIAEHLRVGLTMVGVSLGAVRLIDMPVDVLLGAVMDRTRTRFGRYRLWLVVGAPILMLGVYMMFMAKPGISPAYLMVWYFVMSLGMSITLLAHTAWGAVLAPRYHDRSRLFGVLAAVAPVGMILTLAIPILAKSGKDAQIVPMMGWAVILAIPLCTALPTWLNPETVAKDMAAGPPRAALREYLAVAMKPEVMRLFFGEMSIVLGTGWMTAVYLLFFRDSRGYDLKASSELLGVYIVSGVVGAPTTAWVAGKLGKHRTLITANIAYVAGLSTVLLIPKGNVLAGFPIMLWCGFMAAGFSLLTRSMAADAADVLRLEQGKTRVSLVYGLLTLAAKIAAALAALLSYPLLDLLGYHAVDGLKNSPEAILHLGEVYIIGPSLFVLLGSACFIGWKLDETRHEKVRAELDALDAAAEAAADPG
jgi:glycoside/pentoside/hexuronide:cation symporter, GPH family